MIVVESAGFTDIGKKRRTNEDFLLVDDPLGLYIIADGMGGHRAGDVASRLVVETIRDYIRRADDGNLPPHESAGRSLSLQAGRLFSGIQVSNTAVREAALADNAYRGMGSTVSAVYLSDETLIAANVGDSPIYLVRGGQIKLLSVPHTLLAEQFSHADAASPPEAATLKHVLTRAMGTGNIARPDIYEIQCYQGDRLVIGSDGLSDKVHPDEILALVTSRDPETACRSLVDLANERGGDDNITAIVLKIEEVRPDRPRFLRWLAAVEAGFLRMTRRKR
jgi:protein phosphatase